MNLNQIKLSPAAVKAICAFAGTMSDAHLYLAFPIVPTGTYNWQDERNGEVRVAGRVPKKVIVGKGATRKVEHSSETDSRVFADGTGKGEYYRMEIRDADAYLALLKVAAKDGDVTIHLDRDPWGTNAEGARTVTFSLPRGNGEAGLPLTGTIAHVHINKNRNTNAKSFTLTEMMFSFPWETNRQSFVTYYEETSPERLTVAPAAAQTQTEAQS